MIYTAKSLIYFTGSLLTLPNRASLARKVFFAFFRINVGHRLIRRSWKWPRDVYDRIDRQKALPRGMTRIYHPALEICLRTSTHLAYGVHSPLLRRKVSCPFVLASPN